MAKTTIAPSNITFSKLVIIVEWHGYWKWKHTEIYLSAYNRSLPATGKLDNTIYGTFFFKLRYDKNSTFQFFSPNEETSHVQNESLDHQSKIGREFPRTFFCSIRVGFAHLYVRTPCTRILSIAAKEVRSEAGKEQYDDLESTWPVSTAQSYSQMIPHLAEKQSRSTWYGPPDDKKRVKEGEGPKARSAYLVGADQGICTCSNTASETLHDKWNHILYCGYAFSHRSHENVQMAYAWGEYNGI